MRKESWNNASGGPQRGPPPRVCLSQKEDLFHSSFLDTGFLTGQVTEIENSSSADGTTLVDVDLLDERGSDGEDSLYAYAVRNLTDSKGFS